MSSIDAGLFTPLQRDGKAIKDAEPLAVPGLLNRLAANAQARLSFAVLVALFAFAVLGPVLWPQSAAEQWLSDVSVGPSRSYQALLVDPYAEVDLPAAQQLTAVNANTEFVDLVWPPVDGAARYAIYRKLANSDTVAGLPLATVTELSYRDRLQLRRKAYVYRLVALDAGGSALQELSLRVSPVAALSVFEAQMHGLVKTGVSAASLQGQQVTIPAHPLGTDAFGRDMLARLIHGARTSLFVGLVAPLLFTAFGTLYGALAGISGGRVDQYMMRFADFVVALPFLLFMILLRVSLGIGPGDSGINTIILAMLLLSWPGPARLVRGQVLQLRGHAYVQAATIAGAGRGYLIIRHLFPNILPLLLVSLSFAIPSAIFTEAFLSFIGMGVAPPTPSWGSLCNEGIRHMMSHPHELIFPALLISIAVLAFNLFGDALRDVTDVRTRQRLI